MLWTRPRPLYVGKLTNRTNPLNRGLIAHYQVFQQRATTNTWPDLAGFSPGSLVLGAGGSGPTQGWNPTRRTGGYGEFRLPGPVVYVNCGNTSAVQLSGACSVAAWFLPTDLASANPSYRMVVAKGYNGTNTPYQFGLQKDGGTGGVAKFMWCSFNGSIHGVQWTFGSNLSTNTWYHGVGTFDGSTWALYINGVSVATASDSTGPQSTTKAMLIGAFDVSGTLNYFQGAVDDVRLYNRALSANDASLLYRETATGSKRLLTTTSLPLVSSALSYPVPPGFWQAGACR